MAVRCRTLAATPLEDGSWGVMSCRTGRCDPRRRGPESGGLILRARATRRASRERSAGGLILILVMVCVSLDRAAGTVTVRLEAKEEHERRTDRHRHRHVLYRTILLTMGGLCLVSRVSCIEEKKVRARAM